VLGPFCDGDERDTAAEPGVVIVRGIPVGTYEAVLETFFDVPGIEAEGQSKPRRSVSVRGGEQPTRVVFDLRGQQRGSLLVQVRDETGRSLAGACFALIAAGQTAPLPEVCDNGPGDQNSAAGRILFAGIAAGPYTLTQTVAPRGFTLAADRAVQIVPGAVREVAVTNLPARDQLASLDVETVDRQGNRLGGACFALLRGAATIEACEADRGEPGITPFSDLEPGSYVVRQMQPPPGRFALAGDITTRLDPGQRTRLTVVNDPRPGRLLIRKTDVAGNLLSGACFALTQGGGTRLAVCDNDQSDANRDDGIILLRSVAPGRYSLREMRAPAGFLGAADQDIAIRADQRTQATMIDAPLPRPERIGNLHVFKVDANGRALTGSCFALIDAGGRITASRCDSDDGASDGTIRFDRVAVGRFTLRETRSPSADFEWAPDAAVTIVEGQTVDREVTNRLRTGRILLRKTDTNGAPVAGACFDVREDATGASCTNAAGEVLFGDLTPSVYRVVETVTPPGFLPGAEIDPLTVRPGSTTTVAVSNRPAPPPPNSGALQVVKFLCPVGSGGPSTVIFTASDPSAGGLASTAGCTPGVASFVLDGPTRATQFRTAPTGRFQTTLAAGRYTLTELASGASSSISISVSTLTTVLVINHIALAGEGPASIDVVKQTCDPGFQGQVWLDFAESCLGVDRATSGVTFVLTGPVSARRVTGDGANGGDIRFDQLPPGDYQVREVTPRATAAVYAFCGLDPAAPDLRTVGAAQSLRMAAGQTIICHWFDVPEDPQSSTGAITITKYACPVTTPPPNYDWHNRCDAAGQGVRFTVTRASSAASSRIVQTIRARLWGNATNPIVATTDSDGIARLTGLPPGVYEVVEAGDAWCRAESASVNARGQVTVTAGARATISVFNCVGVEVPPNTGAGPIASDLPDRGMPAATQHPGAVNSPRRGALLR
jgi:hypothetical protein